MVRDKLIDALGGNMFYFPNRLGFVFRLNNFLRFFEFEFESDAVRKMVRDNLIDALGGNMFYFPNQLGFVYQSNSIDCDKIPSLRELVLEAAINEEISLDGVYTLLRINPAAVLPKPTDTGTSIAGTRMQPM